MSQFDLNAFLAGTNTPTSPTPSALSGTSQQFDLNAFLGNTNTPEANAQPTVATVQPTQIEATKTEAVAGALPLSNLEQNTATQQAKAYADQFNQQIAQHKSNALAKYEANDNHSKLDKFFTRRDYDDLMALPEYKAFLKYQGELRQHLDNNPKYSEQQKAYLLEEFDKMANPYHRADTWTNAASDFLVSAVESFPRSGERLANNLGARSWAANWLRSGANKVNGSLSAKNRIEAYETEAAVQAAEQQGGQLAAAQKAAEMAAKYPAYVTNMGARELTAQLSLGALTRGKSLAATGSGMEMGALLGEWANQIEQMPQAELEKLKPYQRRIQEGMTPAEARADLANTNFFEDDGLKPYIIAAGALGSLDRYLSIGKGVSPLVKQSAGKTLIKSILSDMTREALQEGAAQINQNLAISEINPLQKLLQGVGSATFYGGALGAMSGTVGGTVQAAQHHQAAKQQKAVDDLIGATETEEAKTEEAKTAQANPYQEHLKAELAKIEDEEQRKAFEDAFMGDVDLGLLEERKQEKTAYGDFVRNVLAAEQAQQTEQTQPTTAEESETQPQTSSHLTEEQLPRFQQYVQRVNQAYQTNNNAALEQALSEFSPEEQALFAQEVARIFIEGRPDVAAAIKQGKSLQEINDMIANPQQAVETPQNVANQPEQEIENIALTQKSAVEQPKKKVSAKEIIQRGNEQGIDFTKYFSYLNEVKQTAKERAKSLGVSDYSKSYPDEYQELKDELAYDYGYSGKDLKNIQFNYRKIKRELSQNLNKTNNFEQAKNADLNARYSRSPIKSVEANIKRGREAMNTAIAERRTVHRAMFNHDLDGWVDFEWGDVGRTLPNGKTKGAMGISHIIDKRMNVEGMSYPQVTEFLTKDVVDTVATGFVTREKSVGNIKSVNIQKGKTIVRLTKKEGNNAWIVTGYNDQSMNQSRGATTSDLRSNSPILSRTDEGATGTDNVHQSTPQSNPQIAKDQQTLSRILGEETARHIRIIDSNTTIPTGENIEKLKANRVEGWYNKNTQEIYIISDSITANRVMGRDERLAWVAWHELAHFGVNVRFKDRLNMFLKEASRHGAVRGLASRIQGANKGMSEEEALEEAIVELHAAQKTGNWAEIESRYGVIPESLKGSTLQQHLAKLARWLRQLLRFVTRKDPNPESD